MLTFKFFLKEVLAFQCLLKSHVINMAIKLLIKMKHKLIKFGSGLGIIGLSYYFFQTHLHQDRNEVSYPIQTAKKELDS